MIHEWWKERSRVSPKLVAAFNIPNAKRFVSSPLSRLDKVAFYLDRDQPSHSIAILRTISVSTLPLSARAEYFDRFGLAYQMSGRFLLAFRAYRKSHLCYSKMKDRIGQSQTAHHCGDMLRQLEKFKKAHICYRIARQSLKKTQQAYIDALCGEALCYRGVGQFSEAIRRLEKCRVLYKKIGDHIGVAYALWALGTTQRFAGRLKEAQSNLATSVEQYKRLSDPSGLAYARCGLGGTLRMCGLAKESGRLYQQANREFKRRGDMFALAYSFCGQGNALRMQGKYREALLFMNKAIDIYKSLGQKGPLGFVLWSRAQTAIQLKDWRSAKADLSRAEVLFRSVQDHRGRSYIHLGWGIYFKEKGELSRAEKHFVRAYATASAYKLPFELLHAKKMIWSHLSHVWLREYTRLGVNASRFMRYQSLP